MRGCDSRRYLGLLLVLLIGWGAGRAAGGAAPERKATARAMSLRALQKALGAAKTPPAPELLQLCGLTRVDGYIRDRARHDLILFGRADPAAPPLYTSDFVVALRSAAGVYATPQGKVKVSAYPGCSIDFDPPVVSKLAGLGAKIGQVHTADEMEGLLATWEEMAKSPQRVRVLGVPRTSHFAAVMVKADYALKTLVNGSDPSGVPGLTSLPDALLAATQEELRRKPGEPSLLSLFSRFWFFPGQSRFLVEGESVTLEECPVQLLTEEQYLTEGGVAAAPQANPFARQFAQHFTTHFGQIAESKPIYGQLGSLFRLVALTQAMRYQRVEADLGYLLRRFPLSKVEVPQQVPGRSRVVRMEVGITRTDGATDLGQVVLPSCGGVAMEVRLGPANFRRVRPAAPVAKPPLAPARTTRGPGQAPRKAKPATRSAPAALQARPSSEALSWDY